ncbi:MAG: class I SAM-dependent methyltransferase [Betaproteobacteria bacterium]|nr:class I SAM-dependent methyltransferase [Betaproteobacteria bacterium]MBK8690706.1 class I SAM-dependent methyltransferase [Betaproteobacteria bacterium]MBK9675144.1 class I SAM-dependent methyltransferase [Betaproteobacteria bacterium]MBK9702149.1 class I SAM-dependent methyltransferase [Betaproteobacteria bacterium]MBL0289610.1 class I SAM-dependent methyltransferase [Betaproteobacteria bacterium]
MNTPRTVDFFDRQFRRQIDAGEFALNPFEARALPHLRGRVLDLGCGLGNLALAAARRGCEVTALDASPAAIARLQAVARREALALVAAEADFDRYRIVADYDTVVAIGLFMFFPRPRSVALLDDALAHVAPNGTLIVNVLIEGTTYLDMFEPGRYTLFGEDEVAARCAGWRILESRHDTFDAPGATVKRFATVIAGR